MDYVTWNSVQQYSDMVLADGLWELLRQPSVTYQKVSNGDYGNYLISHNQKPYYIGEAKNICKRLKQQFKPTTSTFFRNYQKYLEKSKGTAGLLIDNFKLQYILTKIGRKEVEEFGIVNLPTIINSFQLGKRNTHKISCYKGLWYRVQETKTQILKEAEIEIQRKPYQNWSDNVVPERPGLYLVQDQNDKLIYIGESSDLRERFITHSGRTYFSALRRHIATKILRFELKEANGKKKYLNDKEEKSVTEFLKSCRALFYPTNFGRYELEECMIVKYRPLLNRKYNKV